MGNSVDFHYRGSKTNLLCPPLVSENQRDDFYRKKPRQDHRSGTLRLISRDIDYSIAQSIQMYVGLGSDTYVHLIQVCSNKSLSYVTI